MKVRIGVGLGAHILDDADAFGATLLHMEQCGFDSVWLSEVLSTPAMDPLSGLAYAAGVTRKLKLGTTMLVPGRNPARLAKSLATIDRLSHGRLLLVMVPGLTEPLESQAIGVAPRERGAVLDEVIPLLHRLWSEDAVDHAGPLYTYSGLTLRPRPVQQPLDLWLGGTAPSALRRTGQIGDGWLPSLCTPDEAAQGRATIERFAAEAGREVEAEHFGISLAYARDQIPERQAASIARRRPGLDPSTLIPVGLPALRSRLQQYTDVGFSKFVVRPTDPRPDWNDELDELGSCVLSLQT